MTKTVAVAAAALLWWGLSCTVPCGAAANTDDDTNGHAQRVVQSAVTRSARVAADTRHNVCHNAHDVTPQIFADFVRRKLDDVHVRRAEHDDDALANELFDMCSVDAKCVADYNLHVDERTGLGVDDEYNRAIFRYFLAQWLDVNDASIVQPLHMLCELDNRTDDDAAPRSNALARRSGDAADSAAHDRLEQLLHRTWLLEMRVQSCTRRLQPCALETQRMTFDADSGQVRCVCADDSDDTCHRSVARAQLEPVNYSLYALLSITAVAIIVGIPQMIATVYRVLILAVMYNDLLRRYGREDVERRQRRKAAAAAAAAADDSSTTVSADDQLLMRILNAPDESKKN